MTQALLRLRSQVGIVRTRRLLGMSVNLLGAALLLQVLIAIGSDAWARTGADAAQAVLASALAGGATGLGALGVLMLEKGGGRRGPFVFLALSAGMMFSAATLSLLGPAVRLSAAPAAWDVLASAALGYMAMAALDRLLPHLHAAPRSVQARPAHAMRLMVVAIAVHNLPEGFAVGAGFAGSSGLGWSTALSIGLQNVPEGLIVATALASIGASRGAALALAAATGLLEPLGAVAGVFAAGLGAWMLPMALAAAGGAMVFVVVEELIPEAFKGPSPRAVALSFTAGFFGLSALLAGV